MNKIKKLILVVPIIIVLISGCHKGIKIEGNGNVQTETRYSVSFNYVDNSGDFDVYLVPDTVFFVEIEAESNLIPHIKTVVSGNTLDIYTRENLGNNSPMILYVHTPVITGASLSGSGVIHVDNYETSDFEAILSGSGLIYGNVACNHFYSKISGSGIVDFRVFSETLKSDISGSGEIVLSGEANSADYVISGSGNISSYEFSINDCTAKISGSGNIYTTTANYLDVNISGSGSLYYKGNPQVYTKITGSGQVIKQ